MVPRTGLEPACLSTHAPETCASTIPPPGHCFFAQLFSFAGAENETRTRDPNLGKVMLYQLSYFRIFSTGAKIMSFLVSAKLSIKKVWQKIFYRPNNAFSACSIPQKLKPSTTCCINAEISSLQRLPILPSCV